MSFLFVNREVRESTRRVFQRFLSLPNAISRNSPVLRTGCPHANMNGSPSVRPPYAVV
jgi:hypothetical protein